jgi:hypothetical protein
MRTMAKNPNGGTFVLPQGYTDLGWQLSINHPAVKTCVEAGHKRTKFDNSLYLHRCTDVVTICDSCKTVSHTDMSD